MMADILVTGANGQLGWEISRRAGGRSIIALHRNDLDITNRDAVGKAVAEWSPKVVINAAAYTAVDKAESDPDTAFAVNRDGPAHLAEACAARGIALIHISTDYVFDGSQERGYRESDPVAPLGIYGKSKLAGEEAVRSALQQHIILRTAWVYGIHGQNFVKTMLRLGAERDQLRVVDDQHGCPTFAGDLADAVLIIAERILRGTVQQSGYGTFHCTGSGATTWCGFARKIFEIAAPHLPHNPAVEAIMTAQYPTPAVRPANSVLDCSLLDAVYGIRLRHWEEALVDMLNTGSQAPHSTHHGRAPYQIKSSEGVS